MFLFCEVYSFAKNYVIVVRIGINSELSCAGILRFSNSQIKLFNDVSSFVSTLMYLDPLSLLRVCGKKK